MNNKELKKIFEKYKSEYISFSIPRYFMHFTDIEGKLGINPRTIFQKGIYAYPIDEKIFKEFINYKLPNFQNRKYISIGKLKDTANIINLDNDFEMEKTLKIDFTKIADEVNPELYNEIVNSADYNTFLKSVEKIKGLDSTLHMRKMGIDGVVDLGGGIIHIAEPTQILLINPKCYEFEAQYPNKPSLYLKQADKTALKKNIKDIIVMLNGLNDDDVIKLLKETDSKNKYKDFLIMSLVALSNKKISIKVLTFLRYHIWNSAIRNNSIYINKISQEIQNSIKNKIVLDEDVEIAEKRNFIFTFIDLASINKNFTLNHLNSYLQVNSHSRYATEVISKFMMNPNFLKNKENIEYYSNLILDLLRKGSITYASRILFNDHTSPKAQKILLSYLWNKKEFKEIISNMNPERYGSDALFLESLESRGFNL